MSDTPAAHDTAHGPPDEAALVSVETRAGVQRLRLNRLPSANALNESLQGALSRALQDAAADPAVAAVVLASASDRVFCAGADLKEYGELAQGVARRRRRELLGRTLLQLASFPKPILACVTGKAIGAGCMLAFLCDEIVASDGATFSLPEIRLGMVSPIAATIARHRGGRGALHTMVLRGDVLDGAGAKGQGLVDALAAGAAAADAQAQTRAEALGALDATAYSHTKVWAYAPVRDEICAGLRESERLDALGWF